MSRVAFALLFALVACDSDEPAESTPPDGTYTVRGEVRDVGPTSIAIHHEAIPEFVNREGEPSGMASMSMMFHRPESLAIDGIETGDPVELTFDVRWNGDHTLTLTAIEELPADTVLEISDPHD